MQNYFNYFTEIEERFQQRRGTLLMLSTLDWALVETWREAGVPLAAVLAGIDDAFDKRAAKPARGRGRTSRINGLAWCAQSVMEAAERQSDAAIGAGDATDMRESGFEIERIARFLSRNADAVAGASLAPPADAIAAEIAGRLHGLAAELLTLRAPHLEELDTTLTALESRLVAALVTVAGEAELVALREQATRELAPYRGKMQAVQIRQVQQQFLEKRLMSARGLPRLSLFYMSHE